MQFLLVYYFKKYVQNMSRDVRLLEQIFPD